MREFLPIRGTDPCDPEKIVVDEQCFQIPGVGGTCDPASNVRIDWSGVDLASQQAGNTDTFTTGAEFIELSTPIASGIVSMTYDVADEAIINVIGAGEQFEQVYRFPAGDSGCIHLSTRVFGNAPMTIQSDQPITVSHNTSDPANQGSAPTVIGNGTTTAVVSSGNNSRVIIESAGATFLSVNITNMRPADMNYHTGLEVNAQASIVGGNVKRVTYSDGTDFIYQRDDITVTYTVVDPAWIEISCDPEIDIIPSASLGDIEYLVGCDGGTLVYKKVLRQAGTSSVLGYEDSAGNAITPANWIGGPCVQEVTWTTSEIVEADGPVVVTGQQGIMVALLVDPPSQILNPNHYGEIDGVRVWPLFEMSNLPNENQVVTSTKTLQAFGDARWVVQLGS